MSLNFKNTILFILIFCGFLFFLLNAIELNSNYKNMKIAESNINSFLIKMNSLGDIKWIKKKNNSSFILYFYLFIFLFILFIFFLFLII